MTSGATSRLARDGVAEADPPAGTALVAVLAGTFIAVLDYFVSNVAVPAIQAGLSATATQGQMVVVGYGVAFSAGLITGGRLGDVHGRRRVFGLGMCLFALASTACALSPDATVLIVARIVQGMAAALLVPQVLGIIGTVYRGAERARAFTAYGLVIGAACIFGQLIGGALITLDVAGAGWRMIFLLNVPVCGIALVLARAIPESHGPAGSRIDLRGALLVTTALGLLVYGLVDGRPQGWSVRIWLCLAAAVVAGAVAVRHLRARSGREPLVEPALFRSPTFSFGLGAILVYFLGVGSFFFVLAFYLQLGRQLSALGSGLVFLALGSGYVGCSIVLSRFPFLAARRIALGPLIIATGYVLMGLVAGDLDGRGSAWWLVVPLAVAGVGMGLTTGPLINLVQAAAPPEHAAAASGLLNTAQESGSAIGVVVAGLVFYPSLGTVGRYTHAFDVTLVPLVVFCVAAALLILRAAPRRAPR